MSTNTVARWIREAKALGVEHAHNAADWAYDGNSSEAERSKVLAMLKDGDPAAYDYLPQQPNLSGEWADSLTPRSLFERITGLDAHAEATWSIDAYNAVCDALCDAYEAGVSEIFGPACEAALIDFCGQSVEGMPAGYRETPLFGGGQ
jgi:hypothetical protein